MYHELRAEVENAFEAFKELRGNFTYADHLSEMPPKLRRAKQRLDLAYDRLDQIHSIHS